MNEQDNQNKSFDKNDFLSQMLLSSRHLLLFGEINQESAKSICEQLIVLKHMSQDPVTIIINSQGGHVEAGDTIHDMIQYVGLPINMIGTGWVASAGITVFLAVPIEKRFCLPNTRFMIHQPMGGAEGPAVNIGIEAKEIMRMRKRLERLISDATEKTVEQVKIDIERNYWMDIQEAIDYGIVSKVIRKQTDL